jgi:flagellar protein FlgJ
MLNRLGQAGTADVYTDFQGLAKLRAQAAQDSSRALQETARQFESLFIQMTLKSMRNASSVLESELTDRKTERTYRDMHDQQLALELGKHSPLGLAEVLTRQLGGGQSGQTSLAAKGLAEYRASALPEAPSNPASWKSVPSAATATPASASRPLEAVPTDGNGRFASREDFINGLWPHAQAAAAELGVDPKMLLAQAALESNWGKSMPRGVDGKTSHNLFGIKADRRWEGDSLAARTLEYAGGAPVKQRAAFRAYDSYADSFRDYAAFLKGNPRYGKALENADDPARFIAGLQKAGYATDPNYARKVLSVYKRASGILDAGVDA